MKRVGCTYHGARYYSPWLGRWTSLDPMGSGAGSLNLYGYCQGEPISRSDPDGLQDSPSTVAIRSIPG